MKQKDRHISCTYILDNTRQGYYTDTKRGEGGEEKEEKKKRKKDKHTLNIDKTLNIAITLK